MNCVLRFLKLFTSLIIPVSTVFIKLGLFTLSTIFSMLSGRNLPNEDSSRTASLASASLFTFFAIETFTPEFWIASVVVVKAAQQKKYAYEHSNEYT